MYGSDIEQKDNSGIEEKIAVRREGISWLQRTPKVLELFAGRGKIYRVVYKHFNGGVAFEKDQDKAASIARQRPTWRIYEADCVAGIRHGLTFGDKFSFIDLDPYGNPWESLNAVFEEGLFRDSCVVAVNDGMRIKLRVNGGRDVKSVRPMWKKFGGLHDCYLQACRWQINKKAANAGFDVDRFTGIYGGHNDQMTHYLFKLNRSS